MTPEKMIQSKIISYLSKLADEGHLIDKERRQVGGFAYRKGVPDVWFSYAGIRIEIEVKRPGGKMSSAQETWQRIYKSKMIIHRCFDDFDKFKSFMNALIVHRKKIETFMSALMLALEE